MLLKIISIKLYLLYVYFKTSAFHINECVEPNNKVTTRGRVSY